MFAVFVCDKADILNLSRQKGYDKMGYTYSFVDDASYSAADVNNITKRLVTSGVEDDFSDGVPYNAGRLNIISNKLTTEGVVPEDNTSLKVEVTEDKKIKINSGTAFMESGASFTADEKGITLDYSTVNDNYVYIEENTTLNEIRPVVSDSLPLGYSYVLLATVTKKGVVTDERKFAKGKLPGYMSDFNTPKRVTVSINGAGVYEIDMGRSDYNFVLITEDYDDLTTSAYDSVGIWNKFDGEYISSTGNFKGVKRNSTHFCLRPYFSSSDYSLEVSMIFEGTVLKLDVKTSGSSTVASQRTKFVITAV